MHERQPHPKKHGETKLAMQLNANFKAYRTEIDDAIEGLRSSAQGSNDALKQKLDEMTETTGRMRWVMRMDEMVNGNSHRPEAASATLGKVVLETQLEESTSSLRSTTRADRQKLRKSNKLSR